MLFLTDKTRVLSLLKDLIAASSENPPGREDEVAKILREHLENHGISCKSIGPSKRPNLIFSSHESRRGELIMHGHMDTVPIGNPDSWDHDPFGSEIVQGRLYGRGACDMKGPVAALVETLILYADEKHDQPLVFLATSDEESGCSGAELVAKSDELNGIKYGVCAEPTDLQVLLGEKGLLWSKVAATGKSAHGSRPNEGVNAITLCIEALNALISEEYPFEADDLLGTPTINIGTIQGGVKVNVVPDACEAQIDMRIVKGQSPESIIDLMGKRLEVRGLSKHARVDYILGKPAVLTPSDSIIVKIVCEEVEVVTSKQPSLSTATYGTDCSVLQPKCGILNVICGPGSIEQAHQPNEYIRIDQLIQAVDIYLGIARRFSG